MKRALAWMLFSLVLASAAQAEAGNHIGVWRFMGLGWGAGYHAGGPSGGYGVSEAGAEYGVPEEVAAPEALNTSRLMPSLRKSAAKKVPLPSQSPAANPGFGEQGEARRPLYGPTQMSH